MAKIAKNTDENPVQQVAFDEVEAPPTRQTNAKPKSESQIAAEKIRDDRVLPQRPGSLVTFDEMVSWLDILTPVQFKRINIYVYRSWPEIDRQQVDKQAAKYIDVLAMIPSKDYMIENHGAGDYKFKINDTDSQKTFFEAKLTIPYPEYEPKYDLRETIWAARRNTAWVGKLRAEGRIDNNNDVIKQNSNQSVSPQQNLDAVGLLKEVTNSYKDMMNSQLADMRRAMATKDEGMTGIAAIIAKQMEANDPTKLVSLITAAMPKPDNTMQLVLIEMIKQSSQQAQATMTMMMELFKQNSTGAGNNSGGKENSIGFVEKVLDLAERLGNRNPPTEETTTDKVIRGIETVGVPIMNGVLNAIMAKNTGMPPPNVAPSTTTITREVVPANPSFTGINPYSPEGRAAMAAMNANNQPAPPSSSPELVQLFEKFHPMIINAINSGLDGATFGQSLEQLIGLPMVSQIIANGTNGLFNAAKSVPQLWTVVAPTPERESIMMEWIGDFVNYKQIIEADRMEDERQVN